MAKRATTTKKKHARIPAALSSAELVIITGMSGSGKGSVLRAFEDLGYYCVDNLPAELIPNFAEVVKSSPEIERAALVVDVREGHRLHQLPGMLERLRKTVPTAVVFLEASDAALLRRFSETRRPHPLGRSGTVKAAIADERQSLRPIRAISDIVVDTSKFNVHELRGFLTGKFLEGAEQGRLIVSCISFGFRHGVPADADLVFDVRFLPNPHFVPKYRPLPGNNPVVAKYIDSFPQTREFVRRIAELLLYLLPHYVREGKSYLTIAFGCTGGRHRSVFIAEQVCKRLAKGGYQGKVQHRDIEAELSRAT